MPTDYELRRQENIARNMKLLEGLMGKHKQEEESRIKQTKPVGHNNVPKKKKRIYTPKKHVELSSEDEIMGSRPAKRARSESPQPGLRRSLRQAGKIPPNHQAQSQTQLLSLVTAKAGVDHDREPNRRSGKRVHNPKTFGHIPGIPVGTWWESREDCSNDAIHAPWVAGISGSLEGAYSVALSGGYEDDVDMGDYFTFTGSGGRALKGTKANPKNLRTAPQSSDQSFENPFNKALKISSETRKPVRVIRGYKLPSPYAPLEGYKYDGLYIVDKNGLNDGGFLVCKFAFRRIPGQPPLRRTSAGKPDDNNGSDVDSDMTGV
ncbi:PUA-like domain-containing protein [Multifurca ochricompacta]|uniref:PUA-like domain-containing protein n=1 Tax=Multifurca ochricompacta TaxID=376703 RepID=A0AAD4MD51_9AGAM|nr:PUA-like domain-containing protein [Multifurca ochricompacta]